MDRSNWKQTIMAGLVAAVALACGDAGMQMAGEMMEDAGKDLMDMSAQMLDAGGRAMSDAGRTMRDAGGDAAQAQDSESCGSCTVDGPIEVAGPVGVAGLVRTISASEDLSRMESDLTRVVSMESEVVAGPFVATGLVGAFFNRTIRLRVADAGCPTDPAGKFFWVDGDQRDLQNVAIPIPNGKVLCAETTEFGATAELLWTGFRPYTN